MKKQPYRVWNPDVETPSEGEVIETTSPVFAGETYAEELGFLDHTVLMVQEVETGALYEVYISTELKPEVWGTAKKVR